MSVSFSDRAYEVLSEIAGRQGSTMSEALRDAIALQKWVLDEVASGGRILVERNGEARELLIR